MRRNVSQTLKGNSAGEKVLCDMNWKHLPNITDINMREKMLCMFLCFIFSVKNKACYFEKSPKLTVFIWKNQFMVTLKILGTISFTGDFRSYIISQLLVEKICKKFINTFSFAHGRCSEKYI